MKSFLQGFLKSQIRNTMIAKKMNQSVNTQTHMPARQKTIVMCVFLGLIAVFITVFNGSCNKDPFRVDVSAIETNIKIVRFEKDLFDSDPSAVVNNINLWQKKYGKFFSHFCYVTGIGRPGDAFFPERLKSFITDKNNYEIYKRTQKVFPETMQLEASLNNAFRHYLHYFPDKPVPTVYTYVSGFGESAITDDSLLAIGLDKYLGSNEPLYRKAGIYNYMLKNMHPGKIPSDCINFWAETEFAYNDSVDNLLSRMVYRGMILYFTSAMIPDQPDTLKLGFSKSELNYLNEFEESMWAYLIEHKLLFETDRFTLDKFILEGPFTTDFGRNSPARAVVWIGYKIVEEYMSKNPRITLKDLMAVKDYRRILTLSRYNP